jgi:leucyl aminopeptidase
LETGDFMGSKRSIEVLYHLSGVKAKRVMLVGCGEKDKFDLDVLHDVMLKVASQLKGMKLEHAAIWLAESIADADQHLAVQQIITTLSGCFYSLDDYKSDKKEESIKLAELLIVGMASEQAITQGASIAAGVELAKNMANHPGNVCTPTFLAKNAEKLADQFDSISVEVLEESDMEALGMGAFLSVSKGSRENGKLIIITHRGGDVGDKPVVLVGKGITFDTGGISLKPGAKMDEMKFDMGGAASVLGTMQAIASMKLPMNVVGVVASAENMPSGHATKPGDIVTSMSGKTIEVLNTDAEGRLVLCDALTYVKKFHPDVVIDIATLTGACIVALGHHICGLISNDDELADDLMVAGKDALDQTWRLPYNEKYTKQLKSEFADLGNIGGPAAGTITAGCFLAEFTKDYQWAHLDVAGTAWTGKVATGRPVPLLTQYLINRL